MISALCVAAAITCYSKKQTVTFTLKPPMTCHNCEAEIKDEIRFEKGVRKVESSLEQQTVTIQYEDTKTDALKLAKAFEKLGYKAVPRSDKDVKATNKQ